jgi:hypothetical protein
MSVAILKERFGSGIGKVDAGDEVRSSGTPPGGSMSRYDPRGKPPAPPLRVCETPVPRILFEV